MIVHMDRLLKHLRAQIAVAKSLDSQFVYITINEAKKCLELAEAEDVIMKMLNEQAEQKEGKWVEKTDYMGDTYYDCSVCGESWMTIEGTPRLNGMQYCPHCGAKMELKKE